MNAIEKKIEELRAVANVVDKLEYYINDEDTQAKYYADKITESEANGEEISDDNYYVRCMREHINSGNIFKELNGYLEKKYLK